MNLSLSSKILYFVYLLAYTLLRERFENARFGKLDFSHIVEQLLLLLLAIHIWSWDFCQGNKHNEEASSAKSILY